MTEIINLTRLDKNVQKAYYNEAYESYKEIYNNAMAKGKGNLDPKSLAGKPIQMEINNLETLFKYEKNGMLKYNDYYVSTKADGLRYMMFIANKRLDGTRRVYFVDSSMNFWIVDKFNSIPAYLNVDKCLIDGEILFWGSVQTIRHNETNEVINYRITQTKNSKGLIGFLAFDILYGPTNPEYVKQEENDFAYHFQLGSSGAMVGIKSQTLEELKAIRWPTTRRRQVLELMFLNQDSPLWQLLHVPMDGHLVMAPTDNMGHIINDPKSFIYTGFTVFVSPFVKMDELFEKYTKKSYEFMISNLHKSIEDQYYSVVLRGNEYIKYKKELPYTQTAEVKKGILPQPRSGLNERSGRGYSTDGLIFTPSYEPYLIGSWSFCSNKQFKWKPSSQLTIDFEVGKQHRNEGDGTIFVHTVLVRKSGRSVPFVFDGLETRLRSLEVIPEGTIVEADYYEKMDSKHYFNYLQDRPDKNKPNSYASANGVMAAKFFDSYNKLEYSNFLVYRPGDEIDPVNLDPNLNKEFYYYKVKGIDRVKLNVFGNRIPIVYHEEKIKNQKMKVIYEMMTDTIILFKKVKHVIGEIQEDTETTTIHKLDELFKYGFIQENSDKKNHSSMLDIVFLIKQRYNVSLTETEKINLLKLFDKKKILQTMCICKPIHMFSGIYKNLIDLVQERVKNKNYELELQLKFKPLSYAYISCIVQKFMGSDYVPVPLVRRYSGDKRTTYCLLGETLVPEITIIKETKEKYEVTDKLFNYNYNIILSSEETIEEPPNEEDEEYEYQNRYVVPSMGIYWKLEIIEYANGRTWREAKKNLTDRMQTRVEIEYDPYYYYKDIAKWDIHTINKMFGLQIDTNEDLEEKIEKYVEKNVTSLEHKNIVDELSKILVKIYMALNLEHGNNREYAEDEIVGNLQEIKKVSQRSKSWWINMRRFHNKIKDDLIKYSVKEVGESPDLIDVSVGRGGDIWKWHSSGIQNVLGIDIDEESILEARDRFKNEPKLNDRNYVFEEKSISDPNVDFSKLYGLYDIACCNFTIHYFFKNDETLRLVVERISKLLKNDGLFIGTTIIGERIKEINSKYVEIKMKDANSYSFKLKDVEDSGNYFQEQDLVEYMVDFYKLEHICKKNNLFLVKRDNFGKLYEGSKIKLNDWEKEISFMYDEFIFKKQT
jgi:hypothetical protein